jgi:hypothetical protein
MTFLALSFPFSRLEVVVDLEVRTIPQTMDLVQSKAIAILPLACSLSSIVIPDEHAVPDSK